MQPPLPAGWEERFQGATPYYVNHNTRTTTVCARSNHHLSPAMDDSATGRVCSVPSQTSFGASCSGSGR